MHAGIRVGISLGLVGAAAGLWAFPSAEESVPARATSNPTAGAADLPDLPAPTEHRLDDDAEARNKSARERWFEEMHRSAPEVDWREIELRNGLAEMQRRSEPGIQGSGGAWTELGSRNNAGRMMCGMLGPDGANGRFLYAGSALGGLWRGRPDGSEWTPLGDNLYGGVHDLVVTADPGGGDDVLLVRNGSGLPFLSLDLGVTWTVPADLAPMTQVRDMALYDVGTSQEILVYGHASVSGVGNRSVLYASSDAGQSFQLRYTFDALWNGAMWASRPGLPGQHVYVVHRGACYRSVTAGFTFVRTSDIDTAASEANITACESGNPRVYAALRVGGTWRLYRSGTGGNAFQYVRDLSDYWGPLQASVHDPSLLMYGGVECWRSDDRGNTFQKINSWGEYYGDPANRLHADMMDIRVHPDPDDPTEEIWFISTDGGIYESRDGGVSVQNLSLEGLGVSQYYSTHTSSRDRFRVQAGSQDQGYQVGVVQPALDSGPSTDLAQIISGDYGHLCSTDGSHDLVFSTYPGFVLIAEGEEAPVTRSTGFPDGANHLWLPPVVAHPTVEGSFFFLGNHLWRGDRNGNSWSYTQHSNRDFANGSANYMSAMAFAPGDAQQAYAVDDNGGLYHSTNQGVNWTKSADSAPGNHYFYGNAICVNPNNPLEAFVGGSGYSAVGVKRTRNGGVTWKDMAEGLPDTLVYDLAYSHGAKYVYAATEAGAWRWERGLRTWSPIMEPDTPLTLYWSVEAVPDSDVIRFGTYGRGIWDYHAKPADELWFSLKVDATLQGEFFDAGDLIGWDHDRGCVGMVLDFSDVVAGNVNIDAAARLDDGSILLSFVATEAIAGLIGGPNGDLVDDEDLVRFVPAQLGDDTAGSFEFYLDGSDLGFTTAAMDVDGVSVDANGDVLLSFRGAWNLGGGFSGKDEDLIAFTPTSLGATTAGSLAMFLDGSDSSVRLASNGEDVDAFSFDPAAVHLHLSTVGNFRVPPGLFGDDDDLLQYAATALGSDPDGTFTFFLPGADFAAGGDVDAVQVLRD